MAHKSVSRKGYKRMPKRLIKYAFPLIVSDCSITIIKERALRALKRGES